MKQTSRAISTLYVYTYMYGMIKLYKLAGVWLTRCWSGGGV